MPLLLKGAGVTVQIFIVSAVFAFIIAFIAGLGGVSRLKFVRVFTRMYVEFFRGTSLLVQMFWLFFAFPILLRAYGYDFSMSPYWAGIIALSLNYGAYASEIVRGSIEAVPKGQTEAAIALNMTRWQRMSRIILPQALRMMLPGFGNISIELLKGTSLVSLITLSDLTYQGQMIRNSNPGMADEVFLALLVLYFILALPLIYLSRFFERRASKGVAK
ncbi:amino acid ABC transporter membrane protein 1 (PAAT family) [Melghiribacillus thermohalophilus]|uniref:Amino acid ABC transporter membrane protein 1 (PAAT family) n=1 Tax=Melghiribacillus thermohalophilus TaxID=1324956 RepID=A0A4R3N7H9_9BACI|nr:ectoine/hydroxyectoine ABC transporter permease subunit EhuC [Melghiribacillus thermohalophilus]TCT25095.1 amino acid ABC transporter membrane protein 1 (PAAT family) [Melghiribacillus thermohalophilus]